MRNKYMLLLMMASMTALAGDSVIIQNSEIDQGVADIEILIEPGTQPFFSEVDGNIYITPDELFELGEVREPAISMFISDINASDNVTISGTVYFTDEQINCTSTNWTVGALNNDGTFSRVVSINDVGADQDFYLQCSNGVGTSAQAQVTYYGEEDRVPAIAMYISDLSVSDNVTISGTVYFNDAQTQCASTNWTVGAINSNGTFSQVVPIANTEADRDFFLQCTNSVGTSTQERVKYYGQEAVVQPGNVAITQFTVTADGNNRYVVAYSAVNATSCVGNSTVTDGQVDPWTDYSNNSVNDGQVYTIQNLNVTQTANWTLQCQGNGGPVTSPSRTATFTAVQVPGCTHVDGPENYGITRDSYSYTSFFGDAFPSVNNNSPELDIELGHYATISFVADGSTVHPEGKSKVSFLQANLNFGIPQDSTATISPCPGEFEQSTQTLNNVRCIATLNEGSGDIFVDDNASFGRCDLIDGQTYYINVIHSSNYKTTPPNCKVVRNNACATMMRQIHN